MQKILGFSGKKQSGKSTSAHFLLGFELCALGLIRGIPAKGIKPGYYMTDDGKLHVTDIWGKEELQGVFDPERNSADMRNFLHTEVSPYYKLYSLADLLKKHICIDVLGLSYESCYGTNQQKDAPTHLKWEEMPGVLTDVSLINKYDSNAMVKKVVDNAHIIMHPQGTMSGREVMQFVGTDVFRRMIPTVWVDATVRKIQAEDSLFAVITDVRFPDEVEGIQKANGKVVRLTRNVLGNDQHISETALDVDKFDHSKFDVIIDNANLSLLDKNKLVLNTVMKWGWYEPTA